MYAIRSYYEFKNPLQHHGIFHRLGTGRKAVGRPIADKKAIKESMRPAIQILVTIFLVLSVSQARCDVYRWTDENGVRHFSNVGSPYGKKATQMRESVNSAPKISDKSNFLVTKVFDGDTVQVQGQDLEFRVRMVAIDAPETGGSKNKGQPYSQNVITSYSIHYTKLYEPWPGPATPPVIS